MVVLLDEFVARSEAMVGTGCDIELVSLGGAIADVAEDETVYSNRDAAFDSPLSRRGTTRRGDR